MTSKPDHDQVLMGYLDTLLQDDMEISSAQESSVSYSGAPNEASKGAREISYPLMGIPARVADQQILLPIEQLAGMQVLTGPLVSSTLIESE